VAFCQGDCVRLGLGPWELVLGCGAAEFGPGLAQSVGGARGCGRKGLAAPGGSARLARSPVGLGRHCLENKGMGDFIAQLVELISDIWHADSQVRDRSILGESEADRRSRRSVALLCGGVILLLVLAGLVWWWLSRNP